MGCCSSKVEPTPDRSVTPVSPIRVPTAPTVTSRAPTFISSIPSPPISIITTPTITREPTMFLPPTPKSITPKPITPKPITPKPITPKPITPKPITPKPRPPSIHPEETKYPFNKIGFSKEDPSLLINGYLDEPLVSLEDTLKPFNGKIDRLSYFIEQAKQRQYPTKHGLTQDEAAAIYIYTMNWSPKSLCDHLQEAWESNDPSKMKPWFKYLKLFQSAFNKLPDVNNEIWQVIPYTTEQEQELNSDSNKFYSTMSTCLPSEKDMKDYVEKHPHEKRLIIGYESAGAKLISDYAASLSNKVMLMPGMQLAIANYGVIQNYSSVIYHLRGTAKPPKSIEPEPLSPIQYVSKSTSMIAPPTPKPITPKQKSPSIFREPTIYRYHRIGYSKKNPLLLIDGYLDEPLITLQETLKSFDDKIDQLSYYIGEATKRCYYPTPHGLTHNESAAIYIYTLEWSPKSVHNHLEEALESDDPSKLKPWYKYLRLLKSAFDKLPEANTEIWQVIPYTAEQAQDLISQPKELYSSISACMSSEKALKEHLEKHSSQKKILIGYQSVNGKWIRDYAVGDTNEALIWAGMKLAVVTYEVSYDNGYLIFHLIGRPKPSEPNKPEPIIKYHYDYATRFLFRSD